MTTAFPALCPTRRSYTPGEYATKRFTSISGAGTTRLYGSRAFDAALDLEFSLSDADAELVLQCWHASRGAAGELTLPDKVFEGASKGLQNQIPRYLTWRWAETPQVESVLPDRSRVRVRLVATLDT